MLREKISHLCLCLRDADAKEFVACAAENNTLLRESRAIPRDSVARSSATQWAPRGRSTTPAKMTAATYLRIYCSPLLLGDICGGGGQPGPPFRSPPSVLCPSPHHLPERTMTSTTPARPPRPQRRTGMRTPPWLNRSRGRLLTPPTHLPSTQATSCRRWGLLKSHLNRPVVLPLLLRRCSDDARG